MNDTLRENAARRYERAQNGYEAAAVFATLAEETVRVSDPMSYDQALLQWGKLDELHRQGLLPRVKNFEVRTVFVSPDRPLVGPKVTSHDRYDGAKLDMSVVRPVTGKRGYKSAETAAREAWRAYYGDRFHIRAGVGRERESDKPGERTGVQGRGGWFYWPSGGVAAQGLHGLVKVAKAKHLITQGLNGRWYVYEPEVL